MIDKNGFAVNSIYNRTNLLNENTNSENVFKNLGTNDYQYSEANKIYNLLEEDKNNLINRIRNVITESVPSNPIFKCRFILLIKIKLIFFFKFNLKKTFLLNKNNKYYCICTQTF